MKRLVLALFLLSTLPSLSNAQVIITPSRSIGGGGGGGGGDVVGPASSTDNGLVCFDGTTGKLVKACPANTALSGSTSSTQDGYFGNINLFDDLTPSHYLTLTVSENLSAARTLNLSVNNANRSVTFAGDATLSGTNSGDVSLAGSPDYITISGQVVTRALVNLGTHVTGTLASTAFSTSTDVPLNSLADISNLFLVGNIDGGAAAPTGIGFSAFVDAVAGSAQGSILFRNATVWTVLTPGTSGQFLQTGGGGANVAWANGSGATSPGGSDTQVQYNDGGVFNGDSGLTFNETTDFLSVAGRVLTDGPDFANITAKTADYTLTAADFTVPFNANSAELDANLPTAVGITGRIYVIKKTDTSPNAVIVEPNGSETINGETNIALVEAGDALMIQSNGAGWDIISDGATGITPPAADAVLGWDEDDNKKEFYTFGTGISIGVGNVINVTAGGAPSDYPYWGGGASGSLSAEHNLAVLSTALVINTAGTPSAYGGSTCTNQVVTAISAVGAATCTTITSAYVDSSVWTGTPTSKTFSTESNDFQDYTLYDWSAATQQGATASAGLNLPTSNPCVATDATNTAVFATCDFADDATDNDRSAQFNFFLPAWFNSAGQVDVIIQWFANASSTNSARFCSNTTSKADSESMTSFTFDDETCSDLANDATANDLNVSTISNIDISDWAASELAMFRIKRDADHANDNLTATARVVRIQVLWRMIK